MNGFEVLMVIFITFILIILTSSIRIVPQAFAYVVERLGGYQNRKSKDLQIW